VISKSYVFLLILTPLKGDTKLCHTIFGLLENEGPVVLKTYPLIYPKGSIASKKFQETKLILEDIKKQLRFIEFPNVMPNQGLALQEDAAFLTHQYFPFNLRERLKSLQGITYQDKMWLSFQLLCAVHQFHSESIYHGDIKPQNIMITSWNWLFITYFNFP